MTHHTVLVVTQVAAFLVLAWILFAASASLVALEFETVTSSERWPGQPFRTCSGTQP